MNRQRCFCSGFYMDSKLYVISGINENCDLLTCGECYDFERHVWELIPNMIEDVPSRTVHSSQPQDFMAIVNNELYYLDVPSRHLKVYLKHNNTWTIVGRVPVSIELFEGWGVTLKSLGDELVLICRTLRNHPTFEIIMCFCTPSPELDNVEWHVLDFNRQGRNPSIYNCCVMMA
ncbi:F-box/kelch-repeat protein At3g27150-like [Ananas comosus]|uniref:F-box/kelch-repeat protein At3g27150-like n=1 Tax=Ananas comosus TaxID=4615 RepID=A0A6P5EDM0_ANACO|nr:F-box/kelch-repeat protein At3g27150-like [Ananas comosus]